MRHRNPLISDDDEGFDSSESHDTTRPTVKRELWCASLSSFALALAAFTSLIDLTLSWIASAACTFGALATIGEGTVDETMALLGGCRLIYIVIVYGSVATFVPKKELSGPGRRAKVSVP